MKSIEIFNSQIEDSYPEIKLITEKALKIYHTGGGFRYDFNLQKFKLYSLFSLVKFLKPKMIAELGSGSTTAILNYYSKIEEAEVVVLEESSYWKSNTEKILFDSGGQSSNLKIQESPRLVIQHDPVITKYNYDYSQIKFDLIVVDGPSTELDGVFKLENFNADLLNILEFYCPKAVMIDNRVATYKAFANAARDQYKFSDSIIWTLDQKMHSYKDINFYSYAIREKD